MWKYQDCETWRNKIKHNIRGKKLEKSWEKSCEKRWEKSWEIKVIYCSLHDFMRQCRGGIKGIDKWVRKKIESWYKLFGDLIIINVIG